MKTETIILVSAIFFTGLMAGIFFTWSNAVKPGIGKLSDIEYLNALQAMNRVILNKAFLILFMGAIITVTLVTVLLHNLALAVILGVIIAALVFAWDNAKRIRARKSIDEQGVKHYEIYGPLFFGSITAFNEKFDVINDPQEVIIDFRESRVVDMSAIEALNKITERYLKMGKKLHLRHLSKDCQILLKNADKIIDVNVLEDPNYKVLVDEI